MAGQLRPVEVTRDGTITAVATDILPVNASLHAVRQGLRDAVQGKPFDPEGRTILVEGIAAKGRDFDVVLFNGQGFPLWRGGPMFMAGEI